MQSTLPRTYSRTGCPVCGNQDVMLDEVMESGTLHLAECSHCEHRWTWRGRTQPIRAAGVRSLKHVRPPLTGFVLDEEGEVASAA